MLNFNILFRNQYKTNEQNYKIFFSNLVFCRFAVRFENLKNSARLTINYFIKLN